MTRAELIIELIHATFCSAPLNGWNDAGVAAEILEIADSGELMGLKDFGRAAGRNSTTIMSWISRGQHDVPEPLGRCSAGSIWRAEDIQAWVQDHPELCDK